VISLTLYSPLENMAEYDISKWYENRADMSFTWSCLSPWAKGKWTGMFWKEKGID
tara:strand:+ start:412 stop:576 length:165 start_codon:yes stop_codon:yes gene_type:complete